MGSHAQSDRHGTNVAYCIDRCRCAECTAAHHAYNRRRYRMMGYGKWDPGFVPAEPVRQHVRALMNAGLTRRNIQECAGVDSAVIARVLYGLPSRGIKPAVRIKRKTAMSLLAIEIPEDGAWMMEDARTLLARGQGLPDGLRRDLTRHQRRALVLELTAKGWSANRIGMAVGLASRSIVRARRDAREAA